MEKISVVTVTYNCEDIIESTLKSCTSQDYDNIEYIVIDGASTDNTVQLINKYSDKISKFISEPDKGIYDAMNKGIISASGEWIFFLNAGDIFNSRDTLSRIFLQSFEGIDAVVGDYYSRGQSDIRFHKVERPFYQKNHLYLSMGFNHQCVFVRTVWAKQLMFDLSYKCCADFNMLYSMYNKGAKFVHIDVPVSIIEGRYGFSQTHVNIQRKEEARVRGIDKTLMFKLYDKYKNIRAGIKRFICQ